MVLVYFERRQCSVFSNANVNICMETKALLRISVTDLQQIKLKLFQKFLLMNYSRLILSFAKSFCH